MLRNTATPTTSINQAHMRCGQRVESVPLTGRHGVGDLCLVGQGSVVRRTVLQMWAEANERAETITPAELAEEVESDDVGRCQPF